MRYAPSMTSEDWAFPVGSFGEAPRAGPARATTVARDRRSIVASVSYETQPRWNGGKQTDSCRRMSSLEFLSSQISHPRRVSYTQSSQ